MKRGRLCPPGPLTLGDLRRAVANANILEYSDAALVEIHTPLTGDRRAVQLTITDGDTDTLGDPPTETLDAATDYKGEHENGNSQREADRAEVEQ